jgi:hypothetical protein
MFVAYCVSHGGAKGLVEVSAALSLEASLLALSAAIMAGSVLLLWLGN